MKIFFLTIIYILQLQFFSVNAQPSAKGLLTNLNDQAISEIKEGQFVYFNFDTIDLNIIASLINVIDSNALSSSSCLISPYSSNIPNIYIGEIAIKYIEYVINPNFKYERITKNDFYYALTIEDMRIIKTLYSKWWEANRQYTKDEIKKIREEIGALDGSNYSWTICPEIESDKN